MLKCLKNLVQSNKFAILYASIQIRAQKILLLRHWWGKCSATLKKTQFPTRTSNVRTLDGYFEYGTNRFLEANCLAIFVLWCKNFFDFGPRGLMNLHLIYVNPSCWILLLSNWHVKISFANLFIMQIRRTKYSVTSRLGKVEIAEAWTWVGQNKIQNTYLSLSLSLPLSPSLSLSLPLSPSLSRMGRI